MSLQQPSTRTPLALVADDDPTVRAIMSEVLQQAGFRVEEASDGQMALDRFEQFSPDVVLLDVEMPRLDGYEVCRRIRTQELRRATPVFIITGHDDPKSIQHAYEIGATDFLSKPIPWTMLAHRVRFVLRASDALNEIQGLVQALPDNIFVLNEDGRPYGGIEDGTGQQPAVAELMSSGSYEKFFPEEVRPDLCRKVEVALDTGEPQIHEHAIDNGAMHLETRIVGRDRSTALAIVRNITARKESERQIYDLAYYDRLTDLPNRQLFQQALDKSIARGDDFAVLFVDLDRFKRINDTLGHSMGDALLRSVADRLRECADQQPGSPNVEIARLGGDEFVVMVDGVSLEVDATRVADGIVSALSRPMDCEGHRLVVTPSIGITMFPQDGRTSEDLLMNADSAMYRAKASGRNNHKFYSDTMRVRSLARLGIENELRDAIAARQFSLHYQPKVDIKTWRVVGVEALIRWQHPERGWISPGEFIPVAEESGLIVPIGNWVLREACRQLGLWKKTALSPLSVSVNISSEQIYSEGLLQTVRETLRQNGVSAGSLELEITESLLMRDVDSTVQTLNEFKELGLSISIDDFGTGYSSLSYLTRFPIDTLKIDQSFVRDLHIDSDDAAICAAILAMARKLNMNVVAEGVELDEQLKFLRSHGCNQIQGFLYSKPLPAAELEDLVAGQEKAIA